MILDNPFHILGLPADCSFRDRDRREQKIKGHLLAGKPLAFDDDLYFDGCRRHAMTVETALRSLEDARERLRCGLFWFTQGGILDDRPLRMLRDRKTGEPDLDKVFSLWKKVESHKVSPGYASSLNNFGTLCLLAGLQTNQKWRLDGCSQSELVVRGLRIKAKVVGKLERRALRNFCATFSDEIVAYDVDAIVELFFDGLKQFLMEADKYGVEIPAEAILGALDAGGDRCAGLMGSVATEPGREIETAIADCVTVYKNDTAQASQAASELISVAKRHLPRLEAKVSRNDIAYTSLADKVADTVLDAIFTYFNHHESNDNVSLTLIEEVERSTHYALDIACGVTPRERAQEGIELLGGLKENRQFHPTLAPLYDKLMKWLAEAEQKLDQNLTPRERLEWVVQALKATGTNSIIETLLRYRQAGIALDPAFGEDDEMVFITTTACYWLTSHLLKVSNETYGKDIRARDLLSEVESLFVTSGTFSVTDECAEAVRSNLQLVSHNASMQHVSQSDVQAAAEARKREWIHTIVVGVFLIMAVILFEICF